MALSKNHSTVWKFMLEVTDYQQIEMPLGARVLSATILGGDSSDIMALMSPSSISMWALVDPSEPKELRGFHIIGTGNPMPRDVALEHIATMPMRGGSLIWHLFSEAK